MCSILTTNDSVVFLSIKIFEQLLFLFPVVLSLLLKIDFGLLFMKICYFIDLGYKPPKLSGNPGFSTVWFLY